MDVSPDKQKERVFAEKGYDPGCLHTGHQNLMPGPVLITEGRIPFCKKEREEERSSSYNPPKAILI